MYQCLLNLSDCLYIYKVGIWNSVFGDEDDRNGIGFVVSAKIIELK